MYLNSVLQMCRQLEGDGFGRRLFFMPTRRSNIPCHCKFDTEAMSQIVLSNKERVEARKHLEDRLDYNTWVWDKVVDVSRLTKRLKGWRFHHEITTDGMAASVLFSRTDKRSDGKSKKRRARVWTRRNPHPSRLEWIQAGEI